MNEPHWELKLYSGDYLIDTYRFVNKPVINHISGDIISFSLEKTEDKRFFRYIETSATFVLVELSQKG